MSRIATWHRRPDDPDTVRRWLIGGRRSLPTPTAVSSPEEARRKKLILGGGALYLVCALGAFFLLGKAFHFILPFSNLVWPICSCVSSSRRKSSSGADEGQGDALPVRMRVLDAHGAKTGDDHGRLIACDGWLLFEGERTSFAFTRGEARQPRYEAIGHLRLEDGRQTVFETLGDRPDEPLKRIIRSWEQGPIPEGEAVLPPREVHPEVWADRWGLCIGGILVCLFLLGMGVAFGAGWCIVMSVGLIGLLADRAYVYARRLRAELPQALAPPHRPLAESDPKSIHA